MRRRWWWILIVALTLMIGCSPSGPKQSTEGPSGPLTDVDVSDASPEQSAQISDGEVTADEYEVAFQRFRTCLSAAGYELHDVEFKNHLYHFGVPNAALEDGVDAECYNSEFRFVDILWQSSDLVQSTRQAPPILRECLRERGIEPGESAAEVDEQLREAGVTQSECLQ